MTDKTINLNELLRQARDLQLRYGKGIDVTIDKDYNIEPVTDLDLAEETPEQSQKRADKQSKELLENPGERDAFTRPADAIRKDLQPSDRKEGGDPKSR